MRRRSRNAASSTREDANITDDTAQEYPLQAVRYQYTPADNLPKAREDVYYIVPEEVAQAYPKRLDLLVPNDEVRNEEGSIIGYTEFRCLGAVLMWE